MKTLGLVLREGGATAPLVKLDDRRLGPCGTPAVSSACRFCGPRWPTRKRSSCDRPVQRAVRELNNHRTGRSTEATSRRSGISWTPSIASSRATAHRVHRRALRAQRREPGVGVRAADALPNLHVDTAARIGELGRQPRAARAFFEKHQDRILFAPTRSPTRTTRPRGVRRRAL